MMDLPPTTEEDAVLAAQTLRGDAQAASTLFRRHVDAVFAFVHVRVGRDRALAEDITQEAFVEAWQNLDRFRPGDGRFPAWLVGIARRKVARHLRKPGTRRESPASAALDFLASDEPTPAESLEADEAARAVSLGLALLRADYRQALVWKYRDGLSLDDIGRRTGLSREAVSSRLQRAREAFRAALASS